jgi:acetyltransferase-like isoleucine patch superfamily enzyme
MKALLQPIALQAITLLRRIEYAVRFCGLNVQVDPTAWVARKAIIRCTGGGQIVIGQHCEVHDFAMIDATGGSVRIGDHCSLNHFAIIYGHGGTKIGNRVRIATHSVIIPANHNFRSMGPLHESGVTGTGITIGDDVWLGTGARILDGVSIGSRSVIGAGAVVTRSIPPGCVAMGVPARATAIVTLTVRAPAD